MKTAVYRIPQFHVLQWAFKGLLNEISEELEFESVCSTKPSPDNFAL